MMALGYAFGYGALGALMFYPAIEAWRFLLRQVGLHEPFRLKDYAVIGGLLALLAIVAML